jgi:HSF-type DNA-binding
MVAGAALQDFSPPSSLRDESPGVPEPMESFESHPFSSSRTDINPPHRVVPPTRTFSSYRDWQDVALPSWELPTVDHPVTTKPEDPIPIDKLDSQDIHPFMDFSIPTELSFEKELLDTFDVGHKVRPNGSVGNDFFAYDSSRIVDELMDLAGNVSVVDAPRSIAPLPSVSESLDCTVSTSCQSPPPISAMVLPMARGTVNENNFPRKLYRLLEDCEKNPNNCHIVSWSDDGTCFSVNCKKQFVELILPTYFDQTQYASFRRQLNMYDFVRQGSASTYSNPYFIKNRQDLLGLVQRKSGTPTNKEM